MADAANPYDTPYWHAIFDLRQPWEEQGFAGLVESVAGALGARHLDYYLPEYDSDELAATRAADAILREITEDWVIVRRPATLADLWSAPAEVRTAAEVQP